MSTRAELKGRAKDCLRRYFMPALLVSILQMLLTGTLPLPRMGVSLNVNTVGNAITGGGGIAETLGERDLAYMLMVLPVVLMGMLLSFAISTLYSVFVGNVIYVGSSRYFMESRGFGQDRGIGKLFYGFKSGAYLNTVFTMFMMNLFIFLWSLLLIVPGIIKSYQYRMVPYIMAENPQMNYRDALALSSRMTDGHKMELFILELSFIGWLILGSLLCGIGVIFVQPYINATFAEVYAEMRKASGAAGRELPGFGRPEDDAPYTYYTME